MLENAGLNLLEGIDVGVIEIGVAIESKIQARGALVEV